MKKSIILSVLLVILICLSGCSASSGASSNKNTKESSKTTSAESKTEYKTYSIKDISVDVPENWDYRTKDNFHYFYPGKRADMFYVGVDKITQKIINPSLMNSFLDGFSELDSYKEIKRDEVYINGDNYYTSTFTSRINGAEFYTDVYLTVFNRNLYCFSFGSLGSSEIKAFSENKEKILNSIDFDIYAVLDNYDDYDDYDDYDEELDADEKKTKIYTDDNIELYYVSAEPYEFDDSETVIKFLFVNNTNKTLTLQSDFVVLDGITYNDSIMSEQVAGNSKGYVEMSVENCDNVFPLTIGGDFNYFDEISGGKYDLEFSIPSTEIV